MDRSGLVGLLNFVNMLKSKNIHYSLDHLRDDAIMVRLTLVGVRVEVEFFEDHFEFSSFTGDESVDSDVAALEKLIEQHWD